MQKNKQISKTLLACLFGLFIVACGDGKPPENLGKERILKTYKNCSQFFSVENYKKNNGFEQNPNTYVFEVEFDLVAKRDFSDKDFDLNSALLCGMPFSRSVIGGFSHSAKKGEVRHLKDQVRFIKKEKGWEAQ